MKASSTRDQDALATSLDGAAVQHHALQTDWEALLQQAPVGIVVFSGPLYLITFANDAYFTIMGKSRDALLNKPAFDVMPAAVKQGFPELLNNIRHTGNAVTLHEHKTDIERHGRLETAYLNLVYQPVKEKDGSVSQIMILVTDVTEQKAAAENMQFWAALTQNIADAVIGTDMAYNIISWNKGAELLYGWTYEEAIGKQARELLHTAFPAATGDWQASLEEEGYWQGEVAQQHKDGTMMPVLASIAYVKDSRGNRIGAVGVNRSMREQKKAAEKLRQSEEQFRTMADSIPQLAWMTDAEGWIYWYNQRWYDYTGTTFDEMQGWGWRAVHHPDMIDGVIERFKKALDSGEPWEDTFLLRGKDGRYRWFLSRAQPIRNAEGAIVQWFGTNTDISEQRQTEQALKNAKEQLELTFRNVPSAIYHFDKNGHILYLNEKGAQQMGYANVEEVLAEKNIFQLRKKLDDVFLITNEQGQPLPADQSSAAITFQTGKPSEVAAKFVNKKTGAFFWILSKSAPLFDEKGELSIVLTTTTDITLQKTAEQTVRQSEEKFRTLTEALPQLVWMTDEKGTYEYASNSWRAYTDLDPKKPATWEKIVHANDLPSITKAWTQSLETGETYRAEVRLRSKHGEYRWHLVNGEPIRNEQGSILKWIGAFTDIHLQKTEAERLEAVVQQRTRELQRSNEDLQQFAHVASHDLKEPVRKIRTFSNRLASEFSHLLPERANVYVEKIEDAALRMYKMIDGVLDYSTLSTAEQTLEPVDLNDTIRNVENDLEIMIQQKGAVISRQQLPIIEGYAILVHQLFYNLINNALKFSRPDVQPHIEIEATPLVASQLLPEWRLNRKATYIQLTIQDNGIGFSQDQAERIFKSFTRLNAREKYEGTGLGLALCKKIVERHNGVISAAGMEGMGAIFKILLPVKLLKY